MKSIDLSGKIANTRVAFKAELLFSGEIKVSVYINLLKNQSVRSFSYRAGGTENVHLNSIEVYSKYARMDFYMNWDKSICSANEACYRIANAITSLVIE